VTAILARLSQRFLSIRRRDRRDSSAVPAKTLTLVVTYNEVDNIARLVTQILTHLPASSVLVVDDNSPDGTAKAVQAIADHDPRVSVICRTTERGYGSAMIAGLRYGIEHGFDFILTLDADFSHDPTDLPRLLAGLEGADVAVGGRGVGPQAASSRISRNRGLKPCRPTPAGAPCPP